MANRLALYILIAAQAGLAQAASANPDLARCAGLENQGPDAFTEMSVRLDAERENGRTCLAKRLAACHLDYLALRARQCGKAFSSQNLEFLLRHCKFEAWSLARAQCERSKESISPGYEKFCAAFGR